jgi:hypothetical protein
MRACPPTNVVVRRAFFLRMTEWLQSKLAKLFHSKIKEPQTLAYGQQFKMSSFRGIQWPIDKTKVVYRIICAQLCRRLKT